MTIPNIGCGSADYQQQLQSGSRSHGCRICYQSGRDVYYSSPDCRIQPRHAFEVAEIDDIGLHRLLHRYGSYPMLTKCIIYPGSHPDLFVG